MNEKHPSSYEGWLERDGSNSPDNLIEKAWAEVEAEQPLPPHKVASLIFDSYRFSQGNVSAQSDIFRYIALAQPGITTENIEAAKGVLAGRLHKFIGSPRHGTQGDITKGFYAVGEGLRKPDELRQRLEEMNGKDATEELPVLVDELLRASVARDYAWLVERGGRPRGVEDKGSSSKSTSKYLSQMLFYGLLGNSTTHDVYDRMFKDITSQIQEKWNEPVRIWYPDREKTMGQKEMELPLGEALMAVVEVHVSHYPDDRVRLSAAWQHLLEKEDSPAGQI